MMKLDKFELTNLKRLERRREGRALIENRLLERDRSSASVRCELIDSISLVSQLSQKSEDSPGQTETFLSAPSFVSLWQSFDVVLESACEDRIVVSLLVELFAEKDVVANRGIYEFDASELAARSKQSRESLTL
jgi:hypothetical protein